MKIAIVGAGPSGLVTLYVALKRLVSKANVEIVAFERTKHLGGEWYFSDKPDVIDDLGNPMNSNIYKNLVTNNTTVQMEIHPDFPWPKNSPTFPRCDQVLEHFQNFASKFHLEKYIRYSNLVNMIKSNNGSGLIVDVKNLETGAKVSEIFDYVFLCSGQFRKPYIPSCNTSSFIGQVLHFHDIRDPARFLDKRMLVIGDGFGAMDLACLYAKSSSKFYLSYDRFEPMWNASRERMILKPKLVKAAGKKAYFEDGSSVQVDVIIYATGFLQVYPLSTGLDLDFNTRPFLPPLYLHVVHPVVPRLFFIGKALVNSIIAMRFHAELGSAIIDGSVSLPSTEDMMKEMENFQNQWKANIKKFLLSKGDPVEYFPSFEIETAALNKIAALTKCQPIKPYVRPVTYNNFKNLKYDMFNFRDYRLIKGYEKAPNDVVYLTKNNK